MLKSFIENNVKWFGQFSLMFVFNDLKVFIDPFNLPEKIEKKADYILITHPHFDHLSFENINRILKEETQFYGPADVIKKLSEQGYSNLNELTPNSCFFIEGIEVATIPMYNVVKTKFHPKENNWLGYLITFNQMKIYISGDCERTPEMKGLNADIAFLPLGQVYTMNSVEEAVLAAVDTGAKVVIPVHYGMYEGSENDALDFCNILKNKGVDCLIL